MCDGSSNNIVNNLYKKKRQEKKTDKYKHKTKLEVVACELFDK